MTRARRNLVGLSACALLCACAKLGGFQDFTPGSSTAATTSGNGGAAAAGRAGASSKSGAGGGTAGSDPIAVEGGAAGSPGSAGSPSATGQGGDNQPTTSGGAPALLDDCVLLMHFEEASWSMKAGEVKDSSGAANDGTATSATVTPSGLGQGKFGRAAELDGSGAVLVPDAASLRASTALTVSAWINPTLITGNGPGIVSKRRGFGSDTAFALFLYKDASPDNEFFADVQGEDDRFHTVAVFDVNQWRHVALVYDGTLAQNERSRLYVDGKLDTVGAEHAAQIEPYTSDLMIGELPGGGDRFVGLIDEVAVWTRALSAAEIKDVYAAPGPL